MKRLITVIFAFIAALIGLCGCDSILNEEKLTVTLHQEPTVTTSDSEISVGTFDELKTNILSLVSKYEDSGQIRAYSYDGVIEEDIDLACSQIMNDDPLGAYAVSDISGSATKIVSYYQIEISITYKVTIEQLSSISPVSSIRYLQSDLKDALAEYARSKVVRTRGVTLTEEDALRYVMEIYYDNPMDIVMIPVTTVEFFPDHGTDRIVVFTFGYTKYEANILKAMEKTLSKTVQNIAESVSGDDREILLDLAERLMETTVFDTETASGGDYSNQNSAATAYGALVNGLSVGEGYAMAYKTLCDELGLECDVVLGQLNGIQHAWNIVKLENYYYHVDVSRCDTDGLATSFLRSDTEMSETYSWDTSKHNPCNGPLDYTPDGDIISTDTGVSATDSLT